MNRIRNFTDQDVLCGRGGGTLRHPGNKKYRNLIKSSKAVYLVSSKNEKTAISRSIVAAIRKTNGRFLERSKDLETWHDIGDAKATEKTSQALREGQPKLRKKMIDNGIISDDTLMSNTTEHVISMLPANSPAQIDPNPVFGNDSYTSVNKNNASKMNQEHTALERSLNRLFTETEQSMNAQRPNLIGSCQFQPTSFDKQQMTIVTPPATPPNHPQHRKHIANTVFPPSTASFGGQIISFDQDMIVSNTICDSDFDDSNSILTFDMDDEDMFDDDEDHDDNDELFDSTRTPCFPISTPSPSMTNHVRTLTELKDSVPIYDNDNNPSLSQISPITNHLRALTELKDNVAVHPPFSGQYNNTNFNNNGGFHCQFNGNASGNNMSGFSPALVFP